MYYTLIGKPLNKEDGNDFEIIFGDFDREIVEYEKETYLEEWRGMKIIKTKTASQKEIDKKVSDLNSK